MFLLLGYDKVNSSGGSRRGGWGIGGMGVFFSLGEKRRNDLRKKDWLGK